MKEKMKKYFISFLTSLAGAMIANFIIRYLEDKEKEKQRN